MFCGIYLVTFYVTATVKGTLEIEGVISIDSGWEIDTSVDESYYAKEPKKVTNSGALAGKGNLRNVDKESQQRSIQNTTESLTKYKEDVVIYEKPTRVKNDPKLNEFFEHVRKDTINVFDEIRQRVSHDFQPQVDEISQIYEDKFSRFINSTRKHKIKTRFGSQKVILNTIDTSNKILERLVNYLLGDISQKRSLREGADLTSELHRRIAEIKDTEYQHICYQYNICRSNTGFADFFVDFLDEVLSNDEKVHKSFNGLTEVLKYKDFKFMDEETKKIFKETIVLTEYWTPEYVKSFLIMGKNIIQNRHKPLRVMEYEVDINKTVVMLEVLDILDQNIRPNEGNVKTWNTIKTELRDWNSGKRHDILRIMQNFVFHIGMGIYGMTPETKHDFSMKCKLLFARLPRIDVLLPE